jgi:hypothetical protein
MEPIPLSMSHPLPVTMLFSPHEPRMLDLQTQKRSPAGAPHVKRSRSWRAPLLHRIVQLSNGRARLPGSPDRNSSQLTQHLHSR